MICGHGLGVLLLFLSIFKALLKPNFMAQKPSFFDAQRSSIPVWFHFSLVCRLFFLHPYVYIDVVPVYYQFVTSLMVPPVLCLSSPTTPLFFPLLFHHLFSLIEFLD